MKNNVILSRIALGAALLGIAPAHAWTWGGVGSALVKPFVSSAKALFGGPSYVSRDQAMIMGTLPGARLLVSLKRQQEQKARQAIDSLLKDVKLVLGHGDPRRGKVGGLQWTAKMQGEALLVELLVERQKVQALPWGGVRLTKKNVSVSFNELVEGAGVDKIYSDVKGFFGVSSALPESEGMRRWKHECITLRKLGEERLKKELRGCADVSSIVADFSGSAQMYRLGQLFSSKPQKTFRSSVKAAVDACFKKACIHIKRITRNQNHEK